MADALISYALVGLARLVAPSFSSFHSSNSLSRNICFFVWKRSVAAFERRCVSNGLVCVGPKSRVQ